MSESRFYYIDSSARMEQVNTVGEALSQLDHGGFIWLDYFIPSREDLDVLTEPLGIHSLTIEDCTDTNQVPKMEDFPTNTFAIFNAFAFMDGHLLVDEVDLILGKNFLITVSGYGEDTRHPLQGIERIVELDVEGACRGPEYLMHVILDHIVDQKFIAIEALEDALNRSEENILADPSAFKPEELLGLRRDLLSLRKSLFHEREILVKICRKDCPFISNDAIFHYRDIYDHLAKFFELTEAYRDIVTSLMEVYMSMLNNIMSRASNDMNATVRRLTFITTVFMPLTLIAGIGGMSEWSMMTGPQNWKISYPLFLLLMLIIGIINYYLLKWIEKSKK